MEVSLNDFYIDLFSSFKYDKEKIDNQIGLDFERLLFYFNNQRIQTKNNFYYLLQQLPYSRLFKRLLWVLPTQATLFPFYYFFYKKFNENIIAEIPMESSFSNDFKIVLTPIINKSIKVEMFKNFRILENRNHNLVELGYIVMEIHFVLGNPHDKQVHMTYTTTKI